MNPEGRMFVFVDEVQEIPEWEKTLKRIYDLENDFKFFITGSNFSVLREDLASKLAGRIAYFELYPFSFREFLKTKGITAGKLIVSRKHEIKHHLMQYLETGGFPEVVLENDEEKKKQLLQFYYDTIIYRDIVKRRGIRSSLKLERMINYFLQNISNLSNFSKIGKSVSLSTDSISEYAGYLQDAFLIFSIQVLSFSVKKQEINPKKIYCVDTGIRNVKGFRFSKDSGRLMENAVFVELKRRNCTNPLAEIFYWKSADGREVDFIIKDGAKVNEIIQVCWDTEEEKAKERETGGIVESLKEFKLKEGIIITEDEEKEEAMNGKRIMFVPFWKWLIY